MGAATRTRRKGESGLIPNLPCPRCCDNLFVSCFQDSFVLICGCGHRVTPDELLGTALPEWAPGLEALLRHWEDHLASLRDLESDASRGGHENAAMLVNRHFQNLEARVQLLRMIVRRWPSSDPPAA